MNIEDANEDVVIPGGDETQKPVTPPAAPAATVEDIRTMAREIVQGVATAFQQQGQSQMSQTRQTALNVWVQKQLEKKTSPDAIKALLELEEAKRVDEAHAKRAVEPFEQRQAFDGKIDEMVEEIYDGIVAKLPEVREQLEAAKGGLISRFRLDFNANPDYKAEIIKIDNFKKPNREVMAIALAKHVDKFLKPFNASSRQMPVSRGSSKTGTAGRGTDPTANLDRSQYAMYKAVKQTYVSKYGKEKGEQKALEHVSKLYDD